ncbi:MAG: ribosome maturation factor RimP [Rhodospirillales bacterium]|jgi:ribosome maturation factor RimP|nr:ribosome maturation factor RimP [Rhodospirillales bacterium]
MDLPGRIESLIAPTIEAMGFAIVRVRLSGGNKPSLQVMAERLDGGSIVIDDCAAISRAVSAILDAEDPIAGPYSLEVSSPGIDRPLVRLGDFERFTGHLAKVRTGRPIGGRKRFQGRLLGVTGDAVRLEDGDAAIELPFPDIERAALVLSEELSLSSKEDRR